MMKSVFKILLMVGATQVVGALFAEEPTVDPKLKLTLSVKIAPVAETPIPLLPFTLKLFFREKAFTYQNARSLDKENPPVYPFSFSESVTEMPNITIPFPQTETTLSNIFLRLTGENIFSEPSIYEDLLVSPKNHCLTGTEGKATCEIVLPSYQGLGSLSPENKRVTFRIFRKSSLSKGALPFFPVRKASKEYSQDESPEDYLKKFSYCDDSDPRCNGRDILEIDKILYGFFLYNEFVFDSSIKEPQVAEERPKESYPWSVHYFSIQQSVSRMALLPGTYRIERTIENVDGSVKKELRNIRLQENFIKDDSDSWKILN